MSGMKTSLQIPSGSDSRTGEASLPPCGVRAVRLDKALDLHKILRLLGRMSDLLMMEETFFRAEGKEHRLRTLFRIR